MYDVHVRVQVRVGMRDCGCMKKRGGGGGGERERERERERMTHPTREATRFCVLLTTSKILTVLSEEQVANLRP